MTAHHIVYAVENDGIGVITIDRAEKRNAMTYAMLGAFIEAVRRAGEDDRVKVLIITGAGGTFCAGTDLADLATIPGETRGVRGTAADHDIWWPIVACPKPVIGAVDGFAVGMGAEFTSQCDVRIVTDRARFAWNFAHRGLVPDTGAGSWLLPRLIGPSRALRLLYSGDFLEAAEACEIGYANDIVAPEDLMDAARAEARRYLKSSPFSLRHMKTLVWRGLERDVAAHMKVHVETMSACFKSADHKEGVASFLEKRPANFVGRQGAVPHVVATCSSVRAFTGGVAAFDVEADTVRRMIAALDDRYPGLGDHIRRKLAIAVDGDIHQQAGDVALDPASEVVLIPKIGGG